MHTNDLLLEVYENSVKAMGVNVIIILIALAIIGTLLLLFKSCIKSLFNKIFRLLRDR